MKRLGISHLKDIGLNMAITAEPSIFIRVTRNFVDNQNIPAPFYAPTFYARAMIFLWELRAVFVDSRTDSAFEFIEFLNRSMSDTEKTSIHSLQMFLALHVSTFMN